MLYIELLLAHYLALQAVAHRDWYVHQTDHQSTNRPTEQAGVKAGEEAREEEIKLAKVAALIARNRRKAKAKAKGSKAAEALQFDAVKSFLPSQIRECAQQVKDEGVATITQAFSVPEIERLRQEIEDGKATCKEKVNRRKNRYEYVFTPSSSPFADLARNKVIQGVMRLLLGNKFYLEKAGLIESHPDSIAQRWHMDAPHLFSNRVHLPPATINMFIPVCALTDDNGPTEFQLGTQKKCNLALPKRLAKAKCPIGSLFLYDIRVIHRGGANASKEARPLIYLTFSRIWFRDVINP